MNVHGIYMDMRKKMIEMIQMIHLAHSDSKRGIAIILIMLLFINTCIL